MHWSPVYLAALFLTVPLLPLASGQALPDVPPMAEDPSGDVQATPLGGPTQRVSGFEDVDLTGLWLVEDPDAIHVKLSFAKMDGQAGPDQPGSYTYFAFGGIDYRVALYRSPDNEAWFGSLSSRAEGTPYFRLVGPLAARYDVAQASVWTSVDRDMVTDADGATMARGDQLTGVRAQSFAVPGYAATFNDPVIPVRGALLDVSDRVPDADGLTLDVQFGGVDTSGGITLTAEQPYRASNGAATTYTYELVAQNSGEDRHLRLEALHLPAGWNVTLPGTALDLPAGAAAAFTVQLATPFFHEHGTTRSFHLRLSDPKDEAAWAQAELGVHYLSIPQPAGHHDTLYLHSHPWAQTAAIVNPPLGGTSGVLTMNTLQDDPEDSGQPLIGYSWVAGNEFYGWAGCLDPGLAMGLDFDTARTGTLRLPIFSTKPILDATLSGRLLLVRGGDMQYCFPSEYSDLDVEEVATIAASEPRQVGPNGMEVLETEIVPAADRIPYEPGMHLVLELQLRGAGIGIGGTGAAEIRSGGMLQLPLQEYSDAVAAFTAGDGATAEAPGFSDEEPSAPKDAPGAGFALLALGVVAVALLRRRTQ